MRIYPTRNLKGDFAVSADKSISHRALLFAAVSEGESELENVLLCDDTIATADCLSRLGTGIELGEKGRVRVTPRPFVSSEEELYTANSGTTTRLLAGLLSGYPIESVLAGDRSLNLRPMKRVIEPLERMGARIDSLNGMCPLHIHGGGLRGITYEMPMASAQVKSAILLAGLHAEGETCVVEKTPSRNHTEIMLKAFGADLLTEGDHIVITPKGHMTGRRFEVPGDISTAAFFLAAACVTPGSRITVRGVGLNPTRTGFLDVLKAMGGKIEISNLREGDEPVGDVTASYGFLKGVEIGGKIIPRLIDELPIIAVLAAFAEGETVISDAEELKVKESNRIVSMVTELAKTGIDIRETEDGMVLSGGYVRGADFESYGDHRVAMALAVLGLAADGESTISDAECVGVSCPEFWELYKKVGGRADNSPKPDGTIDCKIYTF